jgi:hypothetical protein
MKKLFSLLFYLCTITISAQEIFVDSIIDPLQKDQLLFEKVFIHTNKPSYFNDDVIWFKAYVGENSNKPSLKTTLLYVNLLDVNGDLIFSNNVLIHKGVGQGQFELNGIAKTDIVYLQAYTNYMRNFGEDNYFLQKIKIVNNSSNQKVTFKNLYDIQVFPEGGYLLEGAENIIGIKSLINGRGVEFSGKIIDSKNNIIASFKNEHLGMTKSNFFYKTDEEYQMVVKLNDTIVKKKIPKAREKGLIVRLDNSYTEYLSLDIKTNNETLKESQKENYKLLFHQRNQIVDFLEISYLDSLNFHLEIDKSTFFNGVNTLTVFNKNQPMSERKFYIEKSVDESFVQIKKEGVKNDSMEYKIQVLDNLKNPLNTNLSLSVLSLNTQNFKETTNIKSAFLLTPFVKGHIENPANYFNKRNKTRMQQLDLLLLTQGWTQYSAKKMTMDLNPRVKYYFEQGFKLSGTTTPLLTNYLGLMTKNNMLIDKLFLNGKTNFSFDKLLVYKGDSVKMSFLDNQNVALKPKNIVIDSIKPIEFPKLNIQKEYLIKTKKKLINNDFLENLGSSVNKLDVVDLKGKKLSERFIERKKTINKYKKEVWDIGKYSILEIPEKYIEENFYVLDFLDLKKHPKYLHLECGYKCVAFVSIDGKEDYTFDIHIQMEGVEKILEKTFISGGIVIKTFQVFTTDNYKNNIQELFSNFVVQRGYNKVKKYYTPIYNYESSIKLTEIDWKPELITNELGEAYFKIKMYVGIDSYLFSINGFSESGILINSRINTLSKN